jgi:hypothetical protein
MVNTDLSSGKDASWSLGNYAVRTVGGWVWPSDGFGDCGVEPLGSVASLNFNGDSQLGSRSTVSI